MCSSVLFLHFQFKAKKKKYDHQVAEPAFGYWQCAEIGLLPAFQRTIPASINWAEVRNVGK
jgi:hypothetical protein